MANVGPLVWYCNCGDGTSTEYYAVTPWAALTSSYVPGTLIRQLSVAGNERVFVQITSATHTSGAIEPTWVVTKGGKTTDATCTWQECTGQPAVNGDLANTPTWAQQHTYNTTITLGLIVTNAANSYYFICSTVTTVIGASEPSWVLTAGSTTTDNGVIWTCIGAVGNFTKWMAPFARLQSAVKTGWIDEPLGGPSLVTIYIGNDHAESQTTTMTITAAANISVSIICVDHTASFPLTSANVTTGATISTTTTNLNITMSGGEINGIVFTSGTGAPATGVSVNLTNSNASLTLSNGSFRKAATGSGQISLSATSKVIMTNFTFSFGNTGDLIVLQGSGYYEWKNTVSAILGSVPTILFGQGTAPLVKIHSVDLSAFTGILTSNVNISYQFVNCLFGNGVTGPTAPGVNTQVDIVNCYSSGTNNQFARYMRGGILTSDTTIVRTGGYTTGTTLVSGKIITNVSASWLRCFVMSPSTIYNTVIGTNRIVTFYGIWNSASLPNNDQIWGEFEYSGSAITTMGTLVNTTKANSLASGVPLTADTSAWDSIVTVRANTNAYSIGDVIKVASNPGRIFFCTTAGTSAGSEPGGYATAVDGGSVTDSGAAFRAGMRFLITKTLNSPQPAQTGVIYAYIYAGLASNTWWIDLKPVLS